nr:hypothetical protein GCM10020063_070140 [Dactylosporangium thailandense]
MAKDYREYKLPDLWKILRDEDAEAGFVHVNTLNRVRAALEQQRDLLRAHRDRLAEGWPPGRSEAATAFVDKLNGMIDTMTATAGAVNRICMGVDEAFAAIRDAKRLLEPMLAAYSERGPGQGLQVADANRSRLDQRAREVLMAADARVTGAGAKISTGMPSVARFAEPTEVVTQATDSGGAGPGSKGRTSGGGSVSALLPAPRFDPPPPSQDRDGPSLGAPADGGGLALSGGTPDQTASPFATPTGNPVAYPTDVIGGGYGADRSRPLPTPAFGVREGMAPGGVIGAPRPANGPEEQGAAAPIAGGGMRSGSSSVAPRRSASGRPAAFTEAEPARSPRGTAGGGYRDRSYERYLERRRTRRGDDDDAWEVIEGVSPLIDAPRERPHDPGPGVVGIDR